MIPQRTWGLGPRSDTEHYWIGVRTACRAHRVRAGSDVLVINEYGGPRCATCRRIAMKGNG